MIKNFETVKQQLEELSKVVNSFKSEAVQLKIIELLFSTDLSSNDTIKTQQKEESDTPKHSSKRKKASAKTKETGTKKSNTPKGRPGPTTTLEELISADFFKKKKTIGDIVAYCNTDLALTYKSTDLSGPLIKMVRVKRLKREKNPETKQYEYVNA